MNAEMEMNLHRAQERLEIVRTRLEAGMITAREIEDEVDHIATAIDLMFINTTPDESLQKEMMNALEL